MVKRTAVCAALALALALTGGRANAARPLVDTHQWDTAFALFARDSAVPWKRIAVRLDTFSGAPVDFAAYAVDPAEVLIAGPNGGSRPLDTSRRTPAARWQFTPPPGYHFESNDVEVPLQNREGFYVVEARRGDAVQQVWVDVTRVGLVAKEGPEGLLLYGTDLGTGKALGGMRITWLVGTRFVYSQTDAGGIARWSGPGRPAFALAEWGRSKSFVSFLPVAPLPGAIVGVRVARGVVRAGDSIDAVGFARKRGPQGYRPLAGDVRLTVAADGRTVASQIARLDQAGAFSGTIPIPPGTPAGDYAVLASAAGATGGTTLHVDAAGDVALSVVPECGHACPAAGAIVLRIAARRAGAPAADVPLRVKVVRSPHVFPPGEPDDQPRWGTTQILDVPVRTDASGVARATIPAPSDGLASTYGIEVTGTSATATTRVVATSGRYALAVEPVATSVDVSEPVGVDVVGFDPQDGTPAARQTVTVTLSHGTENAQQTAVLDASGRAHVVFLGAQPGANFVLAQLDADGTKALDAAEVTVQPRTLGGTGTSDPSPVALSLDRPRYRPGERITVTATLPRASGDALFTLEGARLYDLARAPVVGGKARASLTLTDAPGDIRVGVVLVRDGATVQGSVPVAVDGPGHPRLTALALDKPSYAPGAVARVTVKDGDLRNGATVAIRLADGRPAGGAGFLSLPGLLAAGADTTLSPTGADAPWHAWVVPARSQAANIFALDRTPGAPPPAPALTISAPRPLLWRVARLEGDTFDVPVPHERGRYVLSVVKISDDGDVGAANATVIVQ